MQAPERVYTVSCSRTAVGQLSATQFTHANFVAATAAFMTLSPYSPVTCPIETILSSYSPSTPFGRSIVYAALLRVANFTTTDSANIFAPKLSDTADRLYDLNSAIKSYPMPSPTVLIMDAEHLRSLAEAIQSVAKHSWFYRFAYRHKLAGIIDGFVCRDSLWDRLVFDGARTEVLGADAAGAMRNIIVASGYVEKSLMDRARVLLSLPIVNSFSHPKVASHIFATHPMDLQSFIEHDHQHVGAPGINVEVKLLNVEDEKVEAGADPEGQLLVRGPSVGNGSQLENDWVNLGVKVQILKNGAFQVLG